MENSISKTKSLNFIICNFGYNIDFFDDEFAKNKTMLIEAEHLDTKRVWKLLIEEKGLCASSHGGKNKIMLGPDTIFKAFDTALKSLKSDKFSNNKIITGAFSIEFPLNGKDEHSSLIIVIDIENQFAELYQQCPITLEPVQITNEELHHKQIEHLRKKIKLLEQEIYLSKGKIKNEDINQDKEEYVTKSEFEDLKNKIKSALQKKINRTELNSILDTKVPHEKFKKNNDNSSKMEESD